jgi:hypothetical protein
MTLGGWIFMLCSVGFVLWLTGYCFWKVLAKPAKAPEDGPRPVPPV